MLVSSRCLVRFQLRALLYYKAPRESILLRSSKLKGIFMTRWTKFKLWFRRHILRQEPQYISRDAYEHLVVEMVWRGKLTPYEAIRALLTNFTAVLPSQASPVPKVNLATGFLEVVPDKTILEKISEFYQSAEWKTAARKLYKNPPALGQPGCHISSVPPGEIPKRMYKAITQLSEGGGRTDPEHFQTNVRWYLSDKAEAEKQSHEEV